MAAAHSPRRNRQQQNETQKLEAEQQRRKAVHHFRDDGERGGVDAKAILGSVVKEGLGVDASAEMVVQVGALGHGVKESAQGSGAGFGGFFEGFGGTGLAGGNGRGFRLGDGNVGGAESEDCGDSKNRGQRRSFDSRAEESLRMPSRLGMTHRSSSPNS